VTVSPTLVALIGFMGSGKSTVGPLLAARLGYGFLDLDALIEERAGKPIRRIFAEEDEEVFRDLESQVLQTLPGAAAAAQGQGEGGLVVAAGGGAPLRPENRRWFRERAVTFYLEISFDTFLTRTASDPARPLLLKSQEELRQLYESRLAAYREAGRRVRADTSGPEQIVAEILRLLGRGAV
jgi:shikimate kinase